MDSVNRTADPPKGWRSVSPHSSLKGRIIGGFLLTGVILAIVAGASAWRMRVHRSNLAELEVHSSTASHLQDAEASAGVSALLLQRYVVADDESLVPEIRGHATAAVQSLTEAASLPGVADVTEIAVGGASLADGAGQVIALQQSGDTEGTAAAMEEIVPVFRDFRLKLEAATELELQEVSALRSRADRAGDVAFWLLIATGAGGAILGLIASVTIIRSIIRPLSSLEATAAAASRGDLSVRAETTGLKELSHLGSVLNHMMEAVERRTQELHQANRKMRQRNRQLTDARSLAATDPLTGLGNHRTFHKRIRDEITSAETNGTNVGVILFDIDCFKNVNDSLGHMAGDEVLRQLGLTMRDVIDQDDAYRYGGDEFAAILVEADINKTTKVAERLRVTVEKMTTRIGQKVTVSLGVGSFPEMAASAEELVYRADMAMYWAKSTGKNRVGDWDGLLSRRANGAVTEYVSERGAQTQDTAVALIAALAAKDPVTRDHTERCSWYVARLAEDLGLGKEETLAACLAALLHDIGKLAVPDEVLCKPGPLNEDEWAIMRRHPTTAQHMLSRTASAAEARPAILHHHEHFDGSGYPDGLSGDDIPMASRILLVTDAFDAMTVDRPYRKAMPVEAAIEELERFSGSQFDPAVVQAFIEMIRRDGAHPLHNAAAVEESAVEMSG